MSFVIFGQKDGGKKLVAISNEYHHGVFELPEGFSEEDIRGQGRIKYLQLPEGSRQIGGDPLQYWKDSFQRVENPSEEDWDRARRSHHEQYDGGYGTYEEFWYLGTDLSGDEFPCRCSDRVGEY
jgi:hypothetical protein